MTRIFEALRQVEIEKALRSKEINFPGVEHKDYTDKVQEKMRDLYRVITRRLPSEDGLIIQFLAPRGDTGASRSLRAFAKVCAENLDKQVLIIDMETGSPQFAHFSVTAGASWTDEIQGGHAPKSMFCRVPGTTLTLVKAFHETQAASWLLDSGTFRRQLRDMKAMFDLVLINSPTSDHSEYSFEFSTVVDASILVVEAEKTRWQVAQSTKEKIEARGGRVLGVLLNDLPYHIPEAIYDRL